MAKAHQRLMEMEQCEVEVIAKRRCTILDIITLVEKGINIPDLKHFVWTQTKLNYHKHIERMENQKDIAAEEDQASKARLVPLFLMGSKVLMPDVMLDY